MLYKLFSQNESTFILKLRTCSVKRKMKRYSFLIRHNYLYCHIGFRHIEKNLSPIPKIMVKTTCFESDRDYFNGYFLYAKKLIRYA